MKGASFITGSKNPSLSIQTYKMLYRARQVLNLPLVKSSVLMICVGFEVKKSVKIRFVCVAMPLSNP